MNKEQSLLSLTREVLPPGPVGTKILFDNDTALVTHTITVEKNGSWKDSITCRPKPQKNTLTTS
jgi:hypothetical protein